MAAETLSYLVKEFGYVAIFVGTFLEGETILVLGGFAAHEGFLQYWYVVLAAFCGSFCGDQLWFYLGRRYGGAFILKRPKLKQRAEKFHVLLSRYNTFIILIFRFLYGLRNVAPFVIGSSDISRLRFFVLNMIGAIIWAIAGAALGFFLGSAAERFLASFKNYQLLAFGVLGLLAVLIWLFFYLRRRRRQAAAQAVDSAAPPAP